MTATVDHTMHHALPLSMCVCVGVCARVCVLRLFPQCEFLTAVADTDGFVCKLPIAAIPGWYSLSWNMAPVKTKQNKKNPQQQQQKHTHTANTQQRAFLSFSFFFCFVRLPRRKPLRLQTFRDATICMMDCGNFEKQNLWLWASALRKRRSERLCHLPFPSASLLPPPGDPVTLSTAWLMRMLRRWNGAPRDKIVGLRRRAGHSQPAARPTHMQAA